VTNHRFTSSDALRSARPLAHARILTVPGPHRFEQGGELPALTICYEVFGTLAADRNNAVLVCHALSGDSHVAQHSPDDDPGWWDALVGPGRHLDTDTLCVICANVLAGCRGTTGPASLAPDGAPWADRFPTLTIGDLAMAQKLLLDHLGIARLQAVVGGSMGGMVAMSLAIRHPEQVGGVVLLATGPRLNAQALAFDVVARNAILQDPDFHGGRYYGRDEGNGPETGLAIARMLGHITYLSREAMAARFDTDRQRPRQFDSPFELRFAVGSYLAHQGGRFVERFDANSYLRLSLALDFFDLGGDAEALARSFAASTCPWLIISFSSDWLFPPEQTQAMVRARLIANQPISEVEVPSRAGHDGFLLEREIAAYGPLVRAFIARCADAVEPPAPSAPRPDLDRIAALIPSGASVLDLGCGDGGLLARLRARGGMGRLVGVERDLYAASTAIINGLDVIQADLNHGLAPFTTGAFDVAVISHTLQAVFDVERIIGELVRVGRTGIVSFANLGHARHRAALDSHGRLPVLEPGRNWWDSPVVRPCSIADFTDLCAHLGLRVLAIHGIDAVRGLAVQGDLNNHADIAVALITR